MTIPKILQRGREMGRAAFCSPMLLPICLTTVATIQLGSAWRGTLSPWKGGGFGMFASTDAPANRWLSVTASTRDGTIYPVRLSLSGSAVPEFSATNMARMVTSPRQAELEALGHAVLMSTVVLDSGSLTTPMSLKHSPRYGDLVRAGDLFADVLVVVAIGLGEELTTGMNRKDIESVRVRVLRQRFARRSGTVTPEVIAEAAVDRRVNQ